MHLRDRRPRAAQSPDRARDGTPGGTPTDDHDVGVGIALHLGRRIRVGDLGDALGPQVDHLRVVDRVVADVAGAVLLLDAADAVHQAGGAGDGPRAGQFLVAHVRPEDVLTVLVERVGGAGEVDGNVGEVLDRGQQPRLGAVGEVAVRQQHHGCAVPHRDPHRLERRPEAVRR